MPSSGKTWTCPEIYGSLPGPAVWRRPGPGPSGLGAPVSARETPGHCPGSAPPTARLAVTALEQAADRDGMSGMGGSISPTC